MGCCGQRRAAWAGSPPAFRPASTATTAPARAESAARPVLRLVYEYAGSGAFTVTSPASGRRYRFERPGGRLEIDARDRALLASLPQLRRVV